MTGPQASKPELAPYRAGAWHYAEYRFKVHDSLVDRLADRLGWSPATRILDLCCGPAHLSIPLARRVGQVVALDIEPAVLEEGARRVAAAGVSNIEFVEGAAERADRLTKGPFDAVTIGWGFHWLADPPSVLAMLSDLSPRGAGAVVIIGDPAAPGPAAEPGGEEPPWHQSIDSILERYLAVTPGPPYPPGRGRPYREILAESPFSVVEDVAVEYRHQILDSPETRIGFLYTLAGTLDRLGGRRDDFEAEVREAIGEVAPRRRWILRRDHALVGRRSAP